MNRWDALLAWLYQRHRTDWQRVKSACRTLSIAEGFGEDWSPLRHAWYWTRPLIELGHVEYDSAHKITACAPGVVLLRQSSRALLSGFWTRQRLSRLGRTAVKRFRKHPDRGPTCWSIVGTREQIQIAAEECDVWLADDPGDQILKRLPTVHAWIETFAEDTSSPTGFWETLTFRDHRPVWVSTPEPLIRHGFYRRRSGQPISVHVTGAARRRVATPDQRSAAMWYESPITPWLFLTRRGCLLLPHGTPQLPVLIARSLVSSAGQLPKREKHDDRLWWRYDAVTLQRARRAATILGQEVQVKETIE